MWAFRTSNLSRIAQSRTATVYALVVAVFFITAVLIPGFSSMMSIRSTLVLASILGVASLGQTIVVLLGGLDLSIPGFIALANIGLATMLGRGDPAWLIALTIVGIPVVIGAFNGFVSVTLGAPALIVTLATGTVVIGGIQWVTHGNTGGSVMPWLTKAVSPASSTLGLPLPPIVVLWIVITAALGFLSHRIPIARQIYATGMNPVAARLSLVPVKMVWSVGFMLSALFGALTGILLAGFSGGANVSVGDPYLLLTIAAVVVGGTSLLGGRGGFAQTLGGAILITELETMFLGLGASTALQEALLGGLIVLLVTLYGREQHLRDRI